MISRARALRRFFENRRFGVALGHFFERIYCINLDDRPDRWSYVRGQFSKFGLESRTQRVSAVDVRRDPGLKKHEKLLRDNFSMLAMCGCMLSHRKIIESAKEEGLKSILVLEDDVKILEGNIKHIRKTLADLGEQDWDVFYLGATYLWPLREVSPYLVSVPDGAYATHAIAYNSSVFDQILAMLPRDPLDYIQSDRFEINALDKWLQSGLLDHRKFYGANPIMVVQGLQDSDIACNQKDGIEQIQIDLFSKNLRR